VGQGGQGQWYQDTKVRPIAYFVDPGLYAKRPCSLPFDMTSVLDFGTRVFLVAGSERTCSKELTMVLERGGSCIHGLDVLCIGLDNQDSINPLVLERWACRLHTPPRDGGQCRLEAVKIDGIQFGIDF
jgi:hypothetical protein